MLGRSMHHNVLSKPVFLARRSKRAFYSLARYARFRGSPELSKPFAAYHYCICFSVHAYARTDTSARAQFLDRYPRLLPRVYTQSAYA